VIGDVPEDERRAKGWGRYQRWEIHQRIREITETLRETLQNERCAGEQKSKASVRACWRDAGG